MVAYKARRDLALVAKRTCRRTPKISGSRQRDRPSRLTSSRARWIALFAVWVLTQLDDRVTIRQPRNALLELANKEIFQRGVGCIAASEPDNAWRRAKSLRHYCKVGILRHDGCASRPCCSKDWRVEGVTQPKLETFLPVIRQILEDDGKAPPKQKHTARRIFERLRDEYGYTGGETVVKDAVREWRISRREVFLPLSHPPGEAQADFGEATVRIAGKEAKVAIFVMTLPYSGAIFVQAFPKECTETFMEGHRRAFEEFGGLPKRISSDNSAIAVIEVLKGRERKLTREFLRLRSHYLFTEHF